MVRRTTARGTGEERLFAAEKVQWMLAGGLETMDAAERQMLLVMAETKIQDGYKPTAEEKQAVDRLRSMAGDDYDAQDIKRKVKKMVKGRTTTDSPPLHLPPVFDRLLKRFRNSRQETKSDPD